MRDVAAQRIQTFRAASLHGCLFGAKPGSPAFAMYELPPHLKRAED